MVMPAIPVSDDAILELLDAGLNHREIGARLGMKHRTVSKRISRAGHANPVPRRPTGPPKAAMTPALTLPTWDGTGPCKDADPELFFNTAPYAVNAAKEVCAGCPFRVECFTGALERGEPWGVFGGELFPDATWAARRRAKKSA